MDKWASDWVSESSSKYVGESVDQSVSQLVSQSVFYLLNANKQADKSANIMHISFVTSINMQNSLKYISTVNISVW